MKLIFICAPFRAPTAWQIEQNVRRAEALALEVWKAGYVAVCPHTNTRLFHGELPDQVWLDGAIEIMGRCDAVILANWALTDGMVAELNAAREAGIPIYWSATSIRGAEDRVATMRAKGGQ